MSLGPLYVLLREVSVQVLCPFFKLDCVSSWCVVMWVLYIFLRSNPCLRYHWQIYFPIWLIPFSFSDVFIAMQSLSNLMQLHLFIPAFISLTLGDISVKILLHGISEIFLPMFPSRTLMVSQLIFKSFIHLEFIFVCGAISVWF